MKKLLLTAILGLSINFSGQAEAQYAASQYDLDYIECSDIASTKAQNSSGAMYLGIFYGCMQSRDYDVDLIS